jgi:hypothetical protein
VCIVSDIATSFLNVSNGASSAHSGFDIIASNFFICLLVFTFESGILSNTLFNVHCKNQGFKSFHIQFQYSIVSSASNNEYLLCTRAASFILSWFLLANEVSSTLFGNN